MKCILSIMAFVTFSTMVFAAGTSDFVGRWVNVNPQSGIIAKINIRVDSSAVPYVYVWTQCQPSPCSMRITDIKVLGIKEGLPISKSASMLLVRATTGNAPNQFDYDFILYRPLNGMMRVLCLKSPFIPGYTTGLGSVNMLKKSN